jgi:hypothetical protein
MTAHPRPTRDEQIAAFWNEVRRRLIDHHHREPDQADLGIGRYRLETERRKLGDTVYNQGVEQTAEIVNGVIEYGPLPDEETP